VRAERARGEPSAGFMIGAALGAWSAASAQLDYDLKNPAAAGPPHASQGAPVDEALDQDCREEKTAFDHLEARARDLDPAAIVQAAGAPDAALADAWRRRRDHPPC